MTTTSRLDADPSHGTVSQNRDGALLWATIDRPDVHNALNADVFAGLEAVLQQVESDPSVRVLIITGSGSKAFSAGADLDEIRAVRALDSAVLERGGAIIRAIERLPIPTIAAVNGLALGGGFELALACTLCVCSQNAKFALPETGLGLMPGYGGTQRLPRRVGQQVARHAVLTGARIGADRAYAVGLVALPPSRPDDFVDDVRVLALAIAARGPLATARSIEALVAADSHDLDEGLLIESRLATACIGSEEAAIGIAAFKNRVAPDFGVD